MYLTCMDVVENKTYSSSEEAIFTWPWKIRVYAITQTDVCRKWWQEKRGSIGGP
jgi:hypothetical protein